MIIDMNIVGFEQASELLRNGAIGVIPTDTVYGLVARADNEPAVTRMYALKNRERKPGTLIASSVDQLLELGVTNDDIAKVQQYWPGPLSAVLTIDRDYLTQDVGSLAMRVTDNQNIVALTTVTGPLISSSANQPGEPHATSIDEAYTYFGDSVDFYVDGGIVSESLPSTIVRPTTDGLEVIRQGSVKL